MGIGVGGIGMAAWQTASTSSTGAQDRVQGGLHIWPQFLVRWLFGSHEKVHESEGAAPPQARFQNICISREAGAGGSAIARLVGRRLGWRVYDEELIEAIAHRMGVPLDEVRSLDELAPSVVQDWLLPLREEYYAPQEAYLDHLAKLIEAIGRAGDSILVGRGAGFMLPRETALSVRIIAPLKVRALRLAERMGVSVRTARRAAKDLDRRRVQFARTMHRARENDPHNYDMVLESHSLSLEIAAEIIVHAVEVGRPGCLPSSPAPRSRSDDETPHAEPPHAPTELWTGAGEPGISLALKAPPVPPVPPEGPPPAAQEEGSSPE
jgi:cytidylate kinase